MQAFPRECTETFLEGHRRALEYFGGVPRRISYDNSAIAVIEVLKGRERKLTKEFLRLQSHYLFQEHFCLVRRANEKGHVERLLGFAGAAFWYSTAGRLAGNAQRATPRGLPVRSPRADARQAGPQGRTPCGRPGRPAATTQAAFRGEVCCRRNGRLAVSGSIRYQRLLGSVKYAHRKLLVVATVEEVRLVYEDRLVARHPRCWQREQTLFEPIHYLALTGTQAGRFRLRRPLEHWQLPECFGLLRRRLEAADHVTARDLHPGAAAVGEVLVAAIDRGGRVCLGHRHHRFGQHPHDR